MASFPGLESRTTEQGRSWLSLSSWLWMWWDQLPWSFCCLDFTSMGWLHLQQQVKIDLSFSERTVVRVFCYHKRHPRYRRKNPIQYIKGAGKVMSHVGERGGGFIEAVNNNTSQNWVGRPSGQRNNSHRVVELEVTE